MEDGKVLGVPLMDWKIAGATGRSAASAVAVLLALIAVAVASEFVIDRFSTTPSVGDSAPKSSPPSTSERGPSWADLTKTQQAALQPLMSTWSRFDPARKQRWLQTATNLTKLSKQEQARAASRMTAWAGLTTLERTRARVHFICAKGYKQARRERLTSVDTARDKVSVHDLPLEVVGPATIRGGPGATTLMLSQIPNSTEAYCPPQLVASLRPFEEVLRIGSDSGVRPLSEESPVRASLAGPSDQAMSIRIENTDGVSLPPIQ